MENLDTMTVAEIVKDNIKTADIFIKNGIDFCCGGNVQLVDVCSTKGVDIRTIKSELIKINATSLNAVDYNAFDLDSLIDIIINKHHKYITEANELISYYADKVAKTHGTKHPETTQIQVLFHQLMDELIPHMQKEEIILFPLIKKISLAHKEGTKQPLSKMGSIQNPILVMENEHTGAGDILKKIEILTNNFTPPVEACNTHRALYSKLEEFQTDLFTHIHLENNILFPKAILLENEVTNINSYDRI